MEKRNINHTEEELHKLSIQIAVWGRAQFDKRYPVLGMIEETGEIAHCILKRRQKIRGFHDKRFFLRHLADGIADLVIYTLHAISIYDCRYVTVEILRTKNNISEDHIIGAICLILGQIQYHGMRTDRNFSEVIALTMMLSEVFEIDFLQAVQKTWARVSKRNWKTNRKTGKATTDCKK